MQQRSLSSILTSISMALGVALVIAVLVIYGVLRTQFMQGAQGYHLIVGAKGGKLQLVLNTVYHLSQPIENIPYSFYKEFTEGRFASATHLAIPYCLGDSYVSGDATYRVVGTTPEMFDKVEYGRTPDGTPKTYQFQQGRNFERDHYFEAVIGSVVAHQAGLTVGDTFAPSHGIVEEEGQGHKHDDFKIVGVLAPTGTPNDRAMFINIEGFYLLENHAKPIKQAVAIEEEEEHEHAHDAEHGREYEHEHAAEAPAAASKADEHGHDEHGHEGHAREGHAREGHAREGHEHAGHDHEHAHAPLPESQREVTAVLLVLDNDLFADSIYTMVNEGQVAQAVYPTREIVNLFKGIVGPLQVILLVLAVLIVVVAGVGIMVAIYNSMSDRSHEIAVMRALGAGRSTVMAIILLESILLSLCGGAAGVIFGHAVIGLVNPLVVAHTGVSLDFLHFDVKELILIPGLVTLASLVGFLPALAAYRTDVAKALSASP
jgi:putative ABC transport system permease protein